MTHCFDVICAVPYQIYAFLTTKDVVALDTACLNQLLRPNFHGSLGQVNNLDMEYISITAQWIRHRMILPRRVELGDFTTLEEVNALLKLTLWVREIEFVGYIHDKTARDNILKLMRSCPRLRSVIGTGGCLSEEEYVKLTLTHRKLVNFTLYDPDLNVAEFKLILQTCTELKFIDIKGCERIMANRAVVMIAGLCPQMESLCLTDLHLVQPEEYRQLAVSCTKLKTVDWVAGYNRSATAVGAFLSVCPGSLETVKLVSLRFEGPELVEMAVRCPMLTRLELLSCSIQQDASIHFAAMLQHCPLLQDILVDGCGWFDNDCFRALRNCSKLRVVCCVGCNVTGDVIASGLCAMPYLETLHCSVDTISHPIFCAVSIFCPQLTSLRVTAPRIHQPVLNLLTAQCTNLTSLYLHSTQRSFTLNCTRLNQLRSIELRMWGTFTDSNLIHLISCCPKLTFVRINAEQSIYTKVAIAHTLACNCPKVSFFGIGMCAEPVEKALRAHELAQRSKCRNFAFHVRVVRAPLLNVVFEMIESCVV